MRCLDILATSSPATALCLASYKELYSESISQAPTHASRDVEDFKAFLFGKDWLDVSLAMITSEPGQLVSVPLGRLHQVVTVAPCLKIAWEFFKSVQTMPKLASIRQQLSSKYTRPTNAPDYMALQGVAPNLIKYYP